MLERLKRRSAALLAVAGLLALTAAVAVALGTADHRPGGGDTELTGAQAAQGAKAGSGRRGPKGPPGPRGKRGKRGKPGKRGATGPGGADGSNNERLYNLNVDWTNANDAAGSDSASRSIPGSAR